MPANVGGLWRIYIERESGNNQVSLAMGVKTNTAISIRIAGNSSESTASGWTRWTQDRRRCGPGSRPGPIIRNGPERSSGGIKVSRAMENCPLGVMRNCPLLDS